MSEPVQLFLLLVILVVPAVLIARTGRRLGQETRRRQHLASWAELHGWRLLGPDEQPVGRWQVWPFTAAEREVSDAIGGVHDGREVTSRRLDVIDGPRSATFHVLTIALDAPQRPRTLLTAGAAEPLDPQLAALAETYPTMSVRLEGTLLVAWLPGPPLLPDLDAYLTTLTPLSAEVW